jgi:2-methylisocitrate lyase-like PEP mutase family enzyme
MADCGAKRVSTGSAVSRAGLQAVLDATHEMKDKSTFSFTNDILSHAKANAYMWPKDLSSS